MNNWNIGDFAKSLGRGAISGAVTFGIGEMYGEAGDWGKEIFRAYTHGFAQGMISEAYGGDFMTGFASAGLSSLAGSAFTANAPDFAYSYEGLYTFSGVSGSIGSVLTGGNFWEGAALGVMNAGLNHARALFKDWYYGHIESSWHGHSVARDDNNMAWDVNGPNEEGGKYMHDEHKLTDETVRNKLFSNSEGDKVDVNWYEVKVPAKNAASLRSYFSSNVGKEFKYNVGYNNCKHYVYNAFTRIGGAKIPIMNIHRNPWPALWSGNKVHLKPY